jgi:hypothetical protein
MQTYSHNVSGEREYGFAQAIKLGETIYVSGQLSHDDDGNLIHAYDFDAQVKQVFVNLGKVLDHFGVTRTRCGEDLHGGQPARTPDCGPHPAGMTRWAGRDPVPAGPAHT